VCKDSILCAGALLAVVTAGGRRNSVATHTGR
jgi:hypothetical protein